MSASAHNPSCLGMWWRLLANRSWVRLCSDGCHRISTEGYMLITVGFLAKGPRNDRSKGRVASSENFVRTNFYEAGFAMVSKEASATYGRTFQALTKAMELCCQVKNRISQRASSKSMRICMLELKVPDVWSSRGRSAAWIMRI
jgi:hypothetical protein